MPKAGSSAPIGYIYDPDPSREGGGGVTCCICSLLHTLLFQRARKLGSGSEVRVAVIAAANAVATAMAMKVAPAMATATARWWFSGGRGGGGSNDDSG